MAVRFNKERHEYGKKAENRLLPVLETIIGEKIVPTANSCDTMDGVSETWDVELKRRTAKYSWADEKIMKEGWLIPACKITRARTSGKRTAFFYSWEKDESLWMFEYTEASMNGLKSYVPFWHIDKQPHFNIPFCLWTRQNVSVEH